jgi:hypothetical protein
VGISAQAKILLVTTTGGTKRGIVMKASTFSAGAVNANGLAGRSFEFKVESNGIVMAKNILVPQGFQWSGNSGAMVPDYGNGSNDWYNISP